MNPALSPGFAEKVYIDANDVDTFRHLPEGTSRALAGLRRAAGGGGGGGTATTAASGRGNAAAISRSQPSSCCTFGIVT